MRAFFASHARTFLPSRPLPFRLRLFPDRPYLVAGINHMAFFLKFQYRQRDAYPLLFQALEEPSIFSRDRVRFEMMRRLGYFVTESSEHFSEYCPYFIHHGAEVVRKFDIPIDEYLRRCESIIGTWEATEKQMLDSKRPVEITRSVEYGSAIINSMETNEPSVIYGNVPNRNLITNLPAVACVEVPCLADAQGIQPTIIGDLPKQLAALIRTNVNVQDLTVEACLTAKREHIYHAVMSDPHASAQLTLDAMWRMTDELIDAHQKDGFLGEFQPTRPQTGRSVSELACVLVSFEESFNDAAGEENPAAIHLNMILENKLSEPFQSSLTCIVREGGFRIAEGGILDISLAPGERESIPLVLQTTDHGSSTPLRLGLKDPPPHVLEIELIRPPRECYTLMKTEDSLPVNLTFAGNRVADGTLSSNGSEIFLDLWINDTNPIWNPSSFWSSSAIELFFLNPGHSGARIESWIVIPDFQAPEIFRRGKANDELLAKECVTSIPEETGYRCRLKLPMEKVGLGKNAPFLLEFAVRVNALGDAHGYTVQSWRGSNRPGHESSAFVLIR